jgi:uncharacterized protein (TIGR02421 family)
MSRERAKELSDRLTDVAKEVRVLGALTWPEHVVQDFLRSFRAKDARLPDITPMRLDLFETREALQDIVREADEADPLEAFVADTARSYALATEMLAAAGTPVFTECSTTLYGRPDELLPGASLTHYAAAQAMLDNTDSLAAAGVLEPNDLCLTAEHVQERLRAAFGAFFHEKCPEVVVDPELASKAAAGSRRVRIRAQTCFSELDVVQLIEHEGFVHTATALNGQMQPILSCMSLSAPRTTLTQEGIATLAEITTRSIDISRLRRLALRTVAIQHALDGADFLDVFRFFLEAGQSDEESARSAMRVFRGGDVRGRIAFTKDTVYLCGLFAVHTFLRKAIAQSRPHLVRRLFVGRIALPDVFRLDQQFAEGSVTEPRFVPHWATDLHRLAAYLAFSAILNKIDLGAVDLESLLT